MIKASVALADTATHDVARILYGSIAEHMDRCVKGGPWAPGEENQVKRMKRRT